MAGAGGVEIGVLGPLRVRLGDGDLSVGGGRKRALLAALAAGGTTGQTVDRLLAQGYLANARSLLSNRHHRGVSELLDPVQELLGDLDPRDPAEAAGAADKIDAAFPRLGLALRLEAAARGDGPVPDEAALARGLSAVDEALREYIARREREIPAVDALNNTH